MDLKKLNHKIYKKMRDEKAVLWSFSSVSSYETCPYEYYLSRILKKKGLNNIYTKSGTLSHDLQEQFYNKEIEKKDMLYKFNYGMLEIMSKGYRFASEKIEKSYLDNMRLYFQNFQEDNRIKSCEVFVGLPLWIYDNKLQDNYLQGWVDMVLEDENGDIHIGDFKSSTIFKGKDLLKKSKQLILYAIAYEFLYHKKVNSIFFDFMKYAEIKIKDKKKSKIIERKDIWLLGDDVDEIRNAYVFVELTDEIKKETIEWFINTIHTINQDNEFDIGEDCGANSYFCNQLCGHKNDCEKRMVDY